MATPVSIKAICTGGLIINENLGQSWNNEYEKTPYMEAGYVDKVLTQFLGGK